MACFPPPSDQRGYATPAALVLALALALVGSAMTVRSVQALRLSKAELDRNRQEFALDGAHLAAAAAVVRSGKPGPYAWILSSDVGAISALAEPESDKLSFEAAAALDEERLAAFGVQDPGGLKTRLAQLAPRHADVADLDRAPLWRACAPSVVSPLGREDEFTYAPRVEPGPGPDPPSWHVGETWRVRVATSAGWRDDRIVRFTGDGRRPAAVVVRRLSRGGDRGGECETLLTDLFGD